MQSSIKIRLVNKNVEIPSAKKEALKAVSLDIWKGFAIEHHILPPMALPEHYSNQHRLFVNIGKPIDFHWKTDGKWYNKFHQTNDFSLQRPQDVNTPKWNQTFNFISIAIQPNFIDEAFGVHNVSLNQQRGVSDEILASIAYNFLNELGNKSLASKIYGQALALALSIHLCSNYSNSGKITFAPKGKLSSFQMKKVIEYGNENIENEIGLEELAKQTNLSLYHFARLFKSTMKISPYQFLLKLKLDRAKQMIKSRCKSFVEIAYELGFTDQAHFCNAFKKATGYSPQEFLKR